MSSRSRNVVVGIVVLVGLGILTWMLLLFAGRVTRVFSSPGMGISLAADRADGVSDGSAMYYRGVQCGRVTLVRLSEDKQGVLIDAQIDPQTTLPANLVGIIKIVSPLSTNAQINLEETGPSQGRLQPGTRLSATYEGNSLLPKEFTELGGELRRQKLIQHMDEAVVSIRAQSERAGHVLESVQQLVDDPALRSDLRQTLSNIRSATETANRVGGNLEKLTTDLGGALTATNRHVDELSKELGSTVTKLNVVVDRFQSVATKIDQGKGTAGLLVNDPKLYQSLVDTSRELNLTVATLQRLSQQWEQEGVTLRLH